jgi:hypothetical protein
MAKWRFVLLLATLAAPALGDERAGVPATKTWEFLIPAEKELGKLPLDGPIPNSWGVPDKLRSGYLTTKEQFVALWKAVGATDPLPDIDFAKSSVVVVEDRAKAFEISEFRDGRPILRFATVGRKIVDRYLTVAVFPRDAVESVVKARK